MNQEEIGGAAEESSMDAAAAALVWHFHIKSRAKKWPQRPFLGGKDVLALLPTGFGESC